MDFDAAKQKKSDAGRAAHPDSNWSVDHVDALKELQDEFCNSFWYADLLDDEVLKVRIQLWCRDIWQELEDMGA